jgi:hypothetical protein
MAAISEATIRTARTTTLIARLAVRLASFIPAERLSRIRLKILVSPSRVCATDGKLMPEGIVGQFLEEPKSRIASIRKTTRVLLMKEPAIVRSLYQSLRSQSQYSRKERAGEKSSRIQCR